MKSLKIKACAEIDAPMVAGLSQQLKRRGGEERWMQATLGVSGLVAANASGDRKLYCFTCSIIPQLSKVSGSQMKKQTLLALFVCFI